MGYILVLLLGTAVVVVVFMAVMSGRKRPTGQVERGADVTQKKPSADQPTPGASQTATDNEAGEAQRRTPPA